MTKMVKGRDGKMRLKRWDDYPGTYNYCRICGHSPNGVNEQKNHVVRFWEPDDGWIVGALCYWCNKDYGDRQPHPDDYAYRDHYADVATAVETDSDPIESIDNFQSPGASDKMTSKTEIVVNVEKRFSRALRHVDNARAGDARAGDARAGDEARPTLTFLKIDNAPDGTTAGMIMSTDGFRLHAVNTAGVPREALHQLHAAGELVRKSEKKQVPISGGYVPFETADADYRYPDVSAVIPNPADAVLQIDVNPDYLIDALKEMKGRAHVRLAFYASNVNRFYAGKEKTVTAPMEIYGYADEDVPAYALVMPMYKPNDVELRGEWRPQFDNDETA